MHGTKQVRLSEVGQFHKQLSTRIGNLIQVVLLDGTITVGKIQAVSADTITIQHMRLKNLQFLFSTIAEVYIDHRV